jgi:hypothetical protein
VVDLNTGLGDLYIYVYFKKKFQATLVEKLFKYKDSMIVEAIKISLRPLAGLKKTRRLL